MGTVVIKLSLNVAVGNKLKNNTNLAKKYEIISGRKLNFLEL